MYTFVMTSNVTLRYKTGMTNPSRDLIVTWTSGIYKYCISLMTNKQRIWGTSNAVRLC